MSNEWDTTFLKAIYFDDLRHLFDLHRLQVWPDTSWLNEQQEQDIRNVSFVENEQYQADSRYYEQIIFEDKAVPTRAESWHDLFNALVWSLFPNTKRILNQQHMEDIREYGLSPRTKRRNHITHFDECGIVLAFSNAELIKQLTEHDWHRAFVENRGLWGKEIQPVVFGHANYEMLLSPFIGLTGKWLGIEVAESFFYETLENQYRHLDAKLASVATDGVFSNKGCLKPLPLLGIPRWHKQNNHPGFYDNVDYFRPKRLK
jgi:hypothetical protein